MGPKHNVVSAVRLSRKLYASDISSLQFSHLAVHKTHFTSSEAKPEPNHTSDYTTVSKKQYINSEHKGQIQFIGNSMGDTDTQLTV
jgi:hypothetical protein